MIEVWLTPDKPHEYFCKGCGQLRLSLKGRPQKCQNCESENIIAAERLNELDKDKLKAEYRARKGGV